MSFDKHEEKEYPRDVQSVYAAALKALETLEGKIASQSPENFQFEAKFPKTILKRAYIVDLRGAIAGGGQIRCLPAGRPGAQADVQRTQRCHSDGGNLVRGTPRTSSGQGRIDD